MKINITSSFTKEKSFCFVYYSTKLVYNLQDFKHRKKYNNFVYIYETQHITECTEVS